MKFLVIVLAIALDRFSDLHRHFHRDEWLRALRARVAGWAEQPVLQVLLVLALPLLGVGVVMYLVRGLLYGLPELLLSLLVLFYALGRGRVDQRLAEYLADWLRGDHQAAWYTIADWLDRHETQLPETSIALHQAVRSAYVGRIFYGLFVPVFWYLLIGPLGAVASVILYLWGNRGEPGPATDLAQQLRNALGWIPARVFAGSCALVGSYGGAARALLEDCVNLQVPAVSTVERAALAALEGSDAETTGDQSIKAEAQREFGDLQELFNRCLMLMLVLVALATIFGWS